jgi:hypothetical protein
LTTVSTVDESPHTGGEEGDSRLGDDPGSRASFTGERLIDEVNTDEEFIEELMKLESSASEPRPLSSLHEDEGEARIRV